MGALMEENKMDIKKLLLITLIVITVSIMAFGSIWTYNLANGQFTLVMDMDKETRDKDSLNLRDVAKAKLDWAIAERERGLSANKKIQVQIHKLDGIITVLEELLGIDSKEK